MLDDSPRSRELDRTRKVAIFLPNWVGDAAMATPALRALRERLPQAEIVGIARPVIADLLRGSPLIDRWQITAPRSADKNLRGWRLVRRLRSERFDLAILLPNSWRSASLAWWMGAKRRIGFARDGRGILLTNQLKPRDRKVPHPALGEYVRLVETLVGPVADRSLELPLLNDDVIRLERFWSRAVGRARPDYVAINTGGAFGPAKNWPRASFAALARTLAEDDGRIVLFVCGPSEREEVQQIVRAVNHPRIVSLANETLSIGLTKAAVAASRLLVTTDSGPRHFAAAFRVPVVTLFGPTHQAWSETNYELASALQIAVDCGPCQQRQCPLGHHRCMRDLSVEHVIAATREQLARPMVA